MRKHSIRKILHGLLDLLPLFVIPVFMVYSHRHQIDTYSVERTEYNTVYMQQSVVNGLVNSSQHWSSEDTEVEYDNADNSIGYSCEGYTSVFTDLQSNICNLNDKVLLSIDIYADRQVIGANTYLNIYACNIEDSLNILYEILIDSTFNQDFKRVQEITINNDYNFTFGFLMFESDFDVGFWLKNVEIINLTQMFGSGNEPTIEEFNTLYPNDYYDVNSNAVAYVPYTRTYNDTDIGSQFIYSLYNATVNYFNTDSVFNLSSLHNWITNNFFNGNMPLGVTVVYHIIVYELIMDIIFLIYAVFMFIVDFASDFLEHCFSWSRKGGA